MPKVCFSDEQKSRNQADTRLAGLGILALGCYSVHAGFHLYHGRPEDLLWACHLGAALVGVGLLIASATLSGIGTLFLCMGTPLWVLALAGGTPFYPTSCFTHIGGLLIGLYACTRLNMPSGVWWKALFLLIVLIAISRAFTPPSANVNVAFAVYSGWESLFPSHPVYLILMLASAGGYFRVMQFVVRRWLGPEPTRKEGS